MSDSKNLQILNGNELIVQGALEAGFSLYTGYPGSPLADYFNILYEKKEELKTRGIRVVIANSEANAAAMASGAKQANRDCIVAMKSMGLHVASDALMVGNFANPGNAGVVVVVGDDPWSLSTSAPADSRFLYKHLHMPFLAPSTPQELKDWIKIALEISRESSLYVGVLVNTYMAEGGGRVEIGIEAKVSPEKVHFNPEKFNLAQNVMVPPNSFFADEAMIKKRFPLAEKILKEKKLDQTFGNSNASIGIMASGLDFEIAKQVLEELDLLKVVALYKVAAPYPLVEDHLVPFLKKLNHIVVIEEKRAFLEGELKSLMLKNQINIEVLGKEFREQEGFPAHGGLNFDVVLNGLHRVFDVIMPTLSDEFKKHRPTNCELTGFSLPKRLPTFCPGCPHRETLSLLKELRGELKEKNIHLISHGDVGCYSLSFLEPFKEMHNLSAMGQGGALGAGMDLFSTNPSVVLMGDSTFFHSGLTDISNSVQTGHNITYIILDNSNTAMTGHQMTPRSGESVEGEVRPLQDIATIAKGLGIKEILEVNPSDRYFYKNKLADYIQRPGTKVIISDKECALTFGAKQKIAERKIFAEGETLKQKVFFQVNSLACEDCRVCVEMTGCPGLSQTEDAYGPKVMIDPQICVADSYCTKLKACPSFEKVIVEDFHPQKFKQELSYVSSDILPLPKITKTLDFIAKNNPWRAVVVGVGGTGITTISRIIAEAAREMDGHNDLSFKFVDQKGLAQRNGRVLGHLAIYPKHLSQGSVIANGMADVILSTDLLDGASSLNFLSATGKLVLDNDYQIPLSMVLDREQKTAKDLKSDLTIELQKKLGANLYLFSAKDLSFARFGKNVYSTAIILGGAFQIGALPFSLDNFRKSFETVIHPSEFNANWLSFTMGRELVYYGEKWVREKYGLTKVDEDEKMLKNFSQSVYEAFFLTSQKVLQQQKFLTALAELKLICPNIPEVHLAQYLHDIIIYDGKILHQEFIDRAAELKAIYANESDFKLALRILAKTFFVKDEVLVSHYMISPLVRAQNEKKYKDLGKRYKVHRMNRPRFDIGSFKIEFDINPKDYMLKVMRHQRWVRTAFPLWHKEERDISSKIHHKLLSKTLTRNELFEMDNIKGYREVRYKKAKVL